VLTGGAVAASTWAFRRCVKVAHQPG